MAPFTKYPIKAAVAAITATGLRQALVCAAGNQDWLD